MANQFLLWGCTFLLLGSFTVINAGVSYIRWGRKVCNGNAQLLYAGYMAGSHYAYPGNGANHLCLPPDPQVGTHIDGVQDLASEIYGVNYQFWDNTPAGDDPFLHDNNNGGTLLFGDAPCAVCYVPTRTAYYVVPAKNTCPSGWTMEYNGYLVAEYHGHAAKTQYQCLDNAPEIVTPGTQTVQYMALLYATQARCGSSIPCSKYPDGIELTCAVCTI